MLFFRILFIFLVLALLVYLISYHDSQNNTESYENIAPLNSTTHNAMLGTMPYPTTGSGYDYNLFNQNNTMFNNQLGVANPGTGVANPGTDIANSGTGVANPGTGVADIVPGFAPNINTVPSHYLPITNGQAYQPDLTAKESTNDNFKYMTHGSAYATSTISDNETMRNTHKTEELQKCSASACGLSNLHPVLDPRFNMRESAKQCLLLEDHLNNTKKRCFDCIRKHFLTVDALLEEAVSLEKNNNERDYYRGLYLRWVGIEKKYAKNPMDSENMDDISKLIRVFRKPLVETYFDTVSEYED